MEPHRNIVNNRNKHIDLPAGRQDSMCKTMFLHGYVVQKPCRFSYTDSH